MIPFACNDLSLRLLIRALPQSSLTCVPAAALLAQLAPGGAEQAGMIGGGGGWGMPSSGAPQQGGAGAGGGRWGIVHNQDWDHAWSCEPYTALVHGSQQLQPFQ